MSNKGKTRYNIKKNDIDICKIIFTKAKDIEGRFDIKISFYNEEYKIKVHQLFRYRNEKINIKDIANKEISYHYGRYDNFVKIQLKNIKEKEPYEEIVYNLVPPNNYSVFPIPIFKLEVNSNYTEPLKILKSNSKHNGIDIDLEDNNTVEFFMINSSLSLLASMDKYEPAYKLLSYAPIEYYASNGGHIGFEKHHYYFGNDMTHTIKRELQAKDLNIIIDSYYNPTYDKKELLPCITFIENELFEEIILNTTIDPIIKNWNKRVSGYIASGISSLNLKKDDTLVVDTIGERLCRRLEGAEKAKLFKKSLNARYTLYNRLLKFNDEIEKTKEQLRLKINKFIYAIIELNKYYIKKYENNELNGEIRDEILWMILTPHLKIEDMNILLAKFLGINNFKIYKSTISYNKKEPVEESADLVYKINDIKSIDFNYCFIEYNTLFDIHIMNSCLNNILEREEFIPLVCRGEDIYITDMKWDNVRKLLKEKDYSSSRIEYRTVHLEQEFTNRNKLLEKVYSLIIK